MPPDAVRSRDLSCPAQTSLKVQPSGNIQFDDPLLAYFCAESMISGMEELGVDHEALLDTYIRAYNDCLKGRPQDMTVGLHLCRGNFKVGCFDHA